MSNENDKTLDEIVSGFLKKLPEGTDPKKVSATRRSLLGKLGNFARAAEQESVLDEGDESASSFLEGTGFDLSNPDQALSPADIIAAKVKIYQGSHDPELLEEIKRLMNDYAKHQSVSIRLRKG